MKSMGQPTVRRQHCPACQTPRNEHSDCRHCAEDLSLLVGVERQADALRALARQSYARGWYYRAAQLAREVIALETTAQDFILLACSQLRAGDFPAALESFGKVRQARQMPPSTR